MFTDTRKRLVTIGGAIAFRELDTPDGLTTVGLIDVGMRTPFTWKVDELDIAVAASDIAEGREELARSLAEKAIQSIKEL